MAPGSVRLIAMRLLLGVSLFFAVDAAVFRSGFYFRWVAPRSALGNVARVLEGFRRLPLTKSGVAVMGNSRVAEGVSAKVATDTASAEGSPLVFASGGIGSSLPRVWYYLLREVPAPAERMKAVVIMLTTYHDNDAERQADRPSDIVFVHPLLRLSDLADFPSSFLTSAQRLQAAQAILFKGLFYKSDVQNLLTNPLARVRAVKASRKHGYARSLRYGGQHKTLEGLRFDLATGALSIDRPIPARSLDRLRTYAEGLQRERLPDTREATAYRRKWLGRLADWCEAHGATLVVFRIPRGPLHYLADADETPTGVVAEMAQAGRVQLLPAAEFNDLERPEYFYDALHLNAAGRAALSPRLARALMQRLAPSN